MVKLIRLNTSNNDAHFKASFDTDITINENSKIALKNLTFESDFGTYTSDSVSGIVEFKGDENIASNFTFSTVEQKTYNRSNQSELEQEVSNAYNRTLFLDKLRGKPDIYGEWKLSFTEDLKYVLEYRQTQAQHIFSQYYINNALKPEPTYPAEVWEQPSYPQNRFASNADFTTLSLSTGTTLANDERYSFIPKTGLGLSKGTGVFYARIKSSATDGANPNGFSMGISFGNPRPQDDVEVGTIDDKERNLEITYKDVNTNYFFRQSNKDVASVETDTGFSPFLVQGGQADSHDIVMFKIDNNANGHKIVSGHIYTSNGGSATEKLVFTHHLTDKELEGTLTPYIYMRNVIAKIELDLIRFTPDPYFLVNGENIVFPDSQQDSVAVAEDDATHNFNEGNTNNNVIQKMRTLIAIYYPNTNGNRLLDPRAGFVSNYNPVFKMPGALAEVLGFNKLNDTGQFLPKNTPTENPTTLGYKIIIPESILNKPFNFLDGRGDDFIGLRFVAKFQPLFLRKDSYIVESMTLPLLSYNSSIDRENTTPRTAIQTMGSRKNILATIPQHTDSGLCQYEPNEIVYIDIKNDNKLNIRNLELRVLDNNFEPIRIVGEADLTLLIDN